MATLGSQGSARCFFTNDSGSLAFVASIDEYFAHLQIVHRSGATSSYAMPIREYDSKFVKQWRPATIADLRPLEGSNFRLPANAPPEWLDAS